MRPFSRPVRQGVTVLVVAVVAAIALAAGYDALRGGSAPKVTLETQPEPEATSTSADRVAPAASGAITGVLYFTGDEDCTLEAVRLPGLEPMAVPAWHKCRFVLSPEATSVSESASGWDPVGDFLFQLDGGTVAVTSRHEPVGRRFAGTAAAWRPDGTLTYAVDGLVREWPSKRVLLTPDDLAAAVRAHPDVPDQGHVLPVTVNELAWLDEEHAVAVLTGVVAGPRETMLAFFEGRDLIAVQANAGARLSDLGPSEQGDFVSVRSGDSFLLLDRRGDLLQAPILSGYRAAAWSPDERRIAIATDRGIAVFRPGEASVERRLPILAHDLAWR